MNTHEFDPVTDFCMCCGISVLKAVEQQSRECPGGDARTYLLARHRLQALVGPILERLGVIKPETLQ